MRIPYTAHNFGRHWGAHLSGSHSLPITWEDLIWSAITVGKPGIAHLFSHGQYSLSDFIVRTHMVYANLRQTPSRLKKSSLYDSLDPTEKGAVSYFIGMMTSKLVSARLLNTPWLFHLSAFQSAGGSVKLSSNSQPDLIGLNSNGDWVVVEAKGRTNGFSNSASQKAKEQTRKLRKINGQYPALRVGTQAYFTPYLRLMIEDPEEYSEDAVDIVAEKSNLIKNYYSFIHSATRNSIDVRNISGRKMRFHIFEDLGISIGLDDRISELLKSKDIFDLEGVLKSDDELTTERDDGVSMFADGLAVDLDKRWSFKNMLRQPESRNHG